MGIYLYRCLALFIREIGHAAKLFIRATFLFFLFLCSFQNSSAGLSDSFQCFSRALGENSTAMDLTWNNLQSFFTVRSVKSKHFLFYHDREKIVSFELPDLGDKLNSFSRKYAYVRATLLLPKKKSIWLRYDNKSFAYQIASVDENYSPEDYYYRDSVELGPKTVSPSIVQEMLITLLEQYRVNFKSVRKKLVSYFDLEQFWELQKNELANCKIVNSAEVQKLEQEMQEALAQYKKNKLEAAKAYSLKWP